MVPTLAHGDTLYTNRLFYHPENGDIIVFKPVHSPETPYIKRVIAVGGQTVDIDRETMKVYVDGEMLNENYIAEPMLSSGNMQYPLTVPEGYVFAMGDNRNHSFDSRDVTVGFVPEKNILGEAVFRILPVSTIGVLK
jgi:signal peptidase I